MDDAFTHVMVYTGDTLEPEERRRQGIAIEPMTCPPNAFRSGTDVIRARARRVVARALGHRGRGGVVMVEQAHVVVVGGGFAGLGCAHELAKHPHHARVTLIDRHDYHQFLPLLYQVATFQLAGGDVEVNLGELYKRHDTVEVVQADVTARRPRRAVGDARRRPDDRRRLPGAGGRKPGELLRHARHRARLPPVLARRRAAAARPDPRAVRGRRARPLTGGLGCS